ncbi:MAG: hypothetical protein KDD73_04140 [Anaerolineales bacterium]|nr:hypothetical protein [Anaerolineales bacterium]MCB9172896.1 SAM-dependent methyltransferase [Ardenticatenales bacterium]
MRPLTPDLALWLTQGEAFQALAELRERPLDGLATFGVLADLRTRYSEEAAAALLDQARLRHRASAKFGALADKLLFTEEALQQASGLEIARYRAQRFAPFARVADLGCGIGGDAIALAAVVDALLAIDLDPVRAIFAEHNLRRIPHASHVSVLEADWTRYSVEGHAGAAFIDPDRRPNGQRVFSLAESLPPLSTLLDLQQRLPHLAIKTMPGIADEEIPAHCSVEWISVAGALKEAVLWFGDLRGEGERVATLLHEGVGWSIDERALPHHAPAVSAPRHWLWEPDDALIRASLVTALVPMLDASQIDPQIAYLTSDEWRPTPFARGWPILADAPFNLKRLNQMLRERHAKVIAVKKRGSPVEPERFRRRLYSDREGTPVTVFLTQHRDQPWMVIGGEEKQEMPA